MNGVGGQGSRSATGACADTCTHTNEAGAAGDASEAGAAGELASWWNRQASYALGYVC